MQESDLREICNLPAQFPSSGLSWIDLVQRSPFPANRGQLNEDDLTEFLCSNPDLIELWIAWSEDKRSTPSPFLRRSGSRYEVGYIESDGGTRPSEFFNEPARACAQFILRELA